MFNTNLYVALALQAKQNSDELLRTNECLFDMYPRATAAQEFRTIHIKGPRRSGHSEAVKRLLDEKSVIAVAPTQEWIRNSLGRINNLLERKVVTVQQVQNGNMPRGFDMVVVDGASRIPKKDMDMIYGCYATRRDVFFVLFG